MTLTGLHLLLTYRCVYQCVRERFPGELTSDQMYGEPELE